MPRHSCSFHGLIKKIRAGMPLGGERNLSFCTVCPWVHAPCFWQLFLSFDAWPSMCMTCNPRGRESSLTSVKPCRPVSRHLLRGGLPCAVLWSAGCGMRPPCAGSPRTGPCSSMCTIKLAPCTGLELYNYLLNKCKFQQNPHVGAIQKAHGFYY